MTLENICRLAAAASCNHDADLSYASPRTQMVTELLHGKRTTQCKHFVFNSLTPATGPREEVCKQRDTAGEILGQGYKNTHCLFCNNKNGHFLSEEQ